MSSVSVSPSVSTLEGCWPSFLECFRVLSKWISAAVYEAVLLLVKRTQSTRAKEGSFINQRGQIMLHRFMKAMGGFVVGPKAAG